ncbi:MAG TPA: alpha/beta hydrolase, partial [Pyrinomonadaceae bacterium]|nr:alpha/beta hydrolase [Pyrinomonadaceae bacterium]
IGFDEARLLARLGNADASIRKFLSVTVGADVLDQLPPAARSVVIENISTLLPTLEHYYESPPVACEHLRRVTLPVLLMRGELSPRLALVGNTKLSECLPNSSEAVLDSTSHGLHIENPTEFGRVVLNFLNSLPPTAA